MSAHRKLARAVALPAAVVGFSALAIAPALAHVTISPGTAAANTTLIATVAVPHGCDGSATTKVIISIPKELVEVTPTRNANWDVTKTMTKLATPEKADDGDEITEKVNTVVYTAKTPLPDGYRDAFELEFDVPDAVGKTLVFPTIQKCEKGETDWTQVAAPGAAEPENPAPTVKVVGTPAEADAAINGLSGSSSAASSSAGSSSTGTKASSGGASKGLAYTGLIVGIVGLLVGAGALAKSSRKA
ncbi:MAG TPA: YcnI family protein [Marmoricola sp.]|jgi:uncharacterized protein YcnI|nr:YcnI family protein [Marmoricola sp.]